MLKFSFKIFNLFAGSDCDTTTPMFEHIDVDREPVRNKRCFVARSQDEQLVPSIRNMVQREDVNYTLSEDATSTRSEQVEVPSNKDLGVTSAASFWQFLWWTNWSMTRGLTIYLPYVISHYHWMQSLDEHNESHSTTNYSSILREKHDTSSGGVLPYCS